MRKIECNNYYYNCYFNGLYTTYKVTRNYELSPVKCYISLHSITTTPPTSLTPLTLTPTYTPFTLTMFPIFKSIPQFPLLPLLHYYHLSLYFLITASCLTFFLSYNLVLPTFPCLTVPYYKPHLRTCLPSTI